MQLVSRSSFSNMLEPAKKCLPLRVCAHRAKVSSIDVIGVFLDGGVLEFIIKTNCNLDGFGAPWSYDFQRF